MTEGARQQPQAVARRQTARIVEAPEPSALTEFDRMLAAAKTYADADVLPDQFKKKPANILIAMEIANRVGQHWLAVAQNLYVVKGRPGWGTSYLIGLARVNHVFEGPITWTDNGKLEKKDGLAVDLEVTAHATLAGGHEVAVTIGMKEAIADGWTSNPKYKTIGLLMLQYRTSSRLINLYAPEIKHGMMTVEELEDMPREQVQVVDLGQLERPKLDAAKPAAVVVDLEATKRFVPAGDLVDEIMEQHRAQKPTQTPQDASEPEPEPDGAPEPDEAQASLPVQPDVGSKTAPQSALDMLLEQLDEVAAIKKVPAKDLLAGITRRTFSKEPLEIRLGGEMKRISEEVAYYIKTVKANAATAAKAAKG